MNCIYRQREMALVHALRNSTSTKEQANGDFSIITKVHGVLPFHSQESCYGNNNQEPTLAYVTERQRLLEYIQGTTDNNNNSSSGGGGGSSQHLSTVRLINSDEDFASLYRWIDAIHQRNCSNSITNDDDTNRCKITTLELTGLTCLDHRALTSLTRLLGGSDTTTTCFLQRLRVTLRLYTREYMNGDANAMARTQMEQLSLALKSNTTLTSLQLDNLDESSICLLRGLYNHGSLQSVTLVLHPVNIGGGTHYIRPMHSFEIMQAVATWLQSYQQDDATNTLNCAVTATTLREISLCHYHFDDTSMECFLQGLQAAPFLVKLTLQSCHFTKDALSTLTRYMQRVNGSAALVAAGRGIQSLHLDSCRVRNVELARTANRDDRVERKEEQQLARFIAGMLHQNGHTGSSTSSWGSGLVSFQWTHWSSYRLWWALLRRNQREMSQGNKRTRVVNLDNNGVGSPATATATATGTSAISTGQSRLLSHLRIEATRNADFGEIWHLCHSSERSKYDELRAAVRYIPHMLYVRTLEFTVSALLPVPPPNAAVTRFKTALLQKKQALAARNGSGSGDGTSTHPPVAAAAVATAVSEEEHQDNACRRRRHALLWALRQNGSLHTVVIRNDASAEHDVESVETAHAKEHPLIEWTLQERRLLRAWSDRNRHLPELLNTKSNSSLVTKGDADEEAESRSTKRCRTNNTEAPHDPTAPLVTPTLLRVGHHTPHMEFHYHFLGLMTLCESIG